MPRFWSCAKGYFSGGTPRSRSQVAIRSTARNGCATGEPLCVDEFAAFQPGQGFDGFAGFLLGEAQIVEILQIEPKLRTRAKEMSEAQGRVAGHGACAMQDLRDAIGRNTELSREFRGAHIEGFEFFGEVLTRVNCSDGHSSPPSDNQQSRRSMVRGIRPATRSKFAIDR